jgi:hypothetical protein
MTINDEKQEDTVHLKKKRKTEKRISRRELADLKIRTQILEVFMDDTALPDKINRLHGIIHSVRNEIIKDMLELLL